MAPEIFAREYGKLVDVWSTGVMLHWLFAQRFPFFPDADTVKASKLDEVADAVSNAPITYDYGPWLTMSPEGVDFIQRCLQRDQSLRMTVHQALQHPWLSHLSEEVMSKRMHSHNASHAV
jgi:calcium/calmodulin-dependent protein kinase I